jgi:pyruvate,water dikinase
MLSRVAEGPVFRLHGVEDFGRFPPGSVPVARTTNPAWTPLFHSAVEVITESGGPLSHGAVTAREVGIPAVMSVRGALSVLQDGERVRVNGSTGTVTRLDVT